MHALVNALPLATPLLGWSLVTNAVSSDLSLNKIELSLPFDVQSVEIFLTLRRMVEHWYMLNVPFTPARL